MRECRTYFVNVDTPRGMDHEYMFRRYSDAEKFYDSVTAETAAYKSLTYDDDKLGTVTVKRELLRREYIDR